MVITSYLQITCDDHTTENYQELEQINASLRISRGTDEAAAEAHDSSMKIYVFYIFCIIFRFFCILDTTNMVKTCDYLYLNNEIHFEKPLKVSEPCAKRRLRNKKRVI